MSNQSMKHLSDSEIIASVLKGNRSDYAILIDRYKNKAFSMIRRMIKNEMESEEILQDCFLKAFNGLNKFKGDSKFSTWFYRIVYNTTISRLSLKRRKTEQEMRYLDDRLNIAYEFADTEKKDISVFLNEVINLLPPNYASVINMFYLQEMTCEEIAEITEQSLANVKVLLHRARNALREIIEKNNYTMELT